MFGAKFFHLAAGAIVERGEGKWWEIDKGKPSWLSRRQRPNARLTGRNAS